MKNTAILRRATPDSMYTYLATLDSNVLDDHPNQTVFSVIDHKFNILGTARVKEKKHGVAVFEILIPARENANALFAATDAEFMKSVGSGVWARLNTRCQNAFCIEVGIMSQVRQPEFHGFNQFHPDGRRAQMRARASA